MKGYKESYETITGITLNDGPNPEPIRTEWRNKLSSFFSDIGKYLYKVRPESNSAKRINGFRDNSKLIREFLDCYSDDDLDKFVSSLSEDDTQLLQELIALKSTHVETYNESESRYKTDDEVLEYEYELYGGLAIDHLPIKLLGSSKKMKLMVNDKNLLITDIEEGHGIYIEEGTTSEEYKDILKKLLLTVNEELT